MGRFRLQTLVLRAGYFALLPLFGIAGAQTPAKAPPPREAILTAAQKLMTAYPYCALVSLDSAGRPSIRTMSPFPPEADMTVWFATNDRSRKYQELLKNPSVTVYYANHTEAEGYVALYGKAFLISDMAEIKKRKRAYWDQAFPGLKHLVLIKVVPDRLEIISYKDQLDQATDTWQPPSVDFPAK